MKKIILLTSCVAIGLSSILTACRKNPNVASSENKASIINYSTNINIYDEIGYLHNNGIFNLLLNDDIVNSMFSIDQIHKSISNRTYDYLYNNSELLSVNSVDSLNNANILTDVIKEKIYNDPDQFWSTRLDEVKNKVSFKELIYINRLKTYLIILI